MATTITKKFTSTAGVEDGQGITITYSGSKNGTIKVTAPKNEEVDRTCYMTVKTADSKVSRTVTVKQTGLRELLSDSANSSLQDSNGLYLASLK